MEHKIADERPSDVPVSLIYNGVDLVRYDHTDPCCTLREEYHMPAEAQIAGVVARLEHEKGHPTLLDAWPRVMRRVPNAWLLVVGEGSRRPELEAQAAALGIAERVVFTGRRDDVPAVTAALDVAVLPSYREAQGLTILEAMALSRPGRGLRGRRHPRDDRGRPDGAPGPAARPGRARPPRSSASSPTTPTPTCSRRAATTWSTSASAWSSWSPRSRTSTTRAPARSASRRSPPRV